MAEEKKGIGKGFKIAIAVVLLVGLSAGGYFIWDYTRAKPKLPDGEGGADKGTGGTGGSGSAGGGTGTGSSSGSGGSGNDSFPIKKGSDGNNVSKFQAALNNFYSTASDFTPLDTDGKFGGKTEAAMKRAYGSKKTEVVQGDIDWLNSHKFSNKPKTK